MSKKEKLALAYEVLERLKLMPILDKEIDALHFSLALIREEDINN